MVHCLYTYARRPTIGPNRNHRTIVDTAPAFGDPATVTDASRVAHPARVADSRCIADPGGITANGAGPMMISGVVRDPMSAKSGAGRRGTRNGSGP